MTLQKINLKTLDNEVQDLSNKQREEHILKVLDKTFRNNINSPTTERVFAIALREAIKDGEFNMGNLEDEILRVWVVGGRPTWDYFYPSTASDRWADLEDALATHYHMELAKRFVTFAKKALATTKQSIVETERRKKALAGGPTGVRRRRAA